MAEFVHQNLEETLPELEQLERIGLFSKPEIRAIVKKRTGHEYRLARLTKSKEDFMRYVQYEINILALIKKRRDRMNYYHKKDEIENAIVMRIVSLFKRASSRFPDDLKVWLSFLQFCKKWRRLVEMSKLYTRVLRLHANNPGLWIMAAKFQLEDNNSAENARALFLRALRHHPKNKKLWVEYFRMELLHADKLRKRLALLKQTKMELEESESNDALMRGDLAKVVYRNAIGEIPDDIPLRLKFIPVCRCFDFASHIEDAVYEDLECDHPEMDQTWNALARRCLVEKGSEETIWQSEMTCHRTFEHAVSRVPSLEMWIHYTDACFERLELEGSSALRDKRLEKTLAVLEDAEKKECVKERTYEKWVEVLEKFGQSSRALAVSQRSTELFAQSVTLWDLRLRVAIEFDEGDPSCHKLMVRELFESAISHVKSKDSLDIWNKVYEWYLTNDPDALEDLFKHALKEHKLVALPFKIHYLEWTATTKGIGKGRKLYHRMSTEKPLSVEFFRKYIDLEEAQPSPKHKRISAAFEDAIKEFGETSPDVWLDYIRLELTHPGGSPGKAMQLHWRAMKSLDGVHVEEFTNGYTLMQILDPGK